ncbi:MAG: hypothetical protein H0Z37_07250 [Firmicutes bacterium]|nr:hypothetical protein [Bacillota bacterium]
MLQTTASGLRRRVHRKVFARTSGLIGGCMLLGLGIVLTVQVGFGAAPWDVFHLSVAHRTGLSLGQASIATSLAIISVTLLLGGAWAVRWGTLVNTVLVGLAIDFFVRLGIGEVRPLALRLLLLALGVFLIACGTVVYTRAGLGAGARDGLILVLSQRLPLTVGRVRLALELCVALIGWALGGPVGIGTAAVALGTGPTADWLFKLMGRGALPDTVRIPEKSSRGGAG